MVNETENNSDDGTFLINLFIVVFALAMILGLICFLIITTSSDDERYEKRTFDTSIQCLTLAEEQDHACVDLKKYNSNYDSKHELYFLKLNGRQCSVSCKCSFDNNKMNCKLDRIIINKEVK